MFNRLNIGPFRYTGITVDPNFTNIGKLPSMFSTLMDYHLFSPFETDTGYAKFGKVTEAEAIDHEGSVVEADSGRVGHGSFYSQLYDIP